MGSTLTLSFADLTYVDPFIDQTCHVFERMFGWNVTFDRPRAKAECTASHDVTGLIPLYGAVVGKVGLSMPRRLASVIASKLLHRDILGIGEEVADVAGELANTIAGRAAAALGGGGIRIGLPEVVIGRGRPLDFNCAPVPLSVVFDASIDCFTLEIGLRLSGGVDAPVATNHTPAKARSSVVF